MENNLPAMNSPIKPLDANSMTATIFNGVSGSSTHERIKTLEETSTHINVAKDQENRICELEGAVTELMDFMKDQLKKDQLKIIEDTEKAKDLLYQYAPQPQPGIASGGGGSGTYTVQVGLRAGLQNLQAAHSHSLNVPTPTPTSVHLSTNVIGIAKRALGLK